MDRVKDWMKNEKLAVCVCMILVFLWGVAMTILVPTWQTPDEDSHLSLIGAGIGNDDLAGILMQDMYLDQGRIRFQYEEKVNIEMWREAITKAPGYDWKECAPRGLSISVIRHLPATIGVELGILLRLPTFWVLELGELFALVFYIIICGCAIRIMPVKKELLLMFMALPMTLQQAASLSYDAVLLPLCFLYIAYLCHMRYEQGHIGWKEVFCTLLLIFLITYIKVPYIFLGLLVFVLPKEKIHLKIAGFEINGDVIRKWRIYAGILMAIIVVIAAYMMRDNFWVNLVVGMALEWKRTLYLFAATGYYWHKYLVISSIGQFGWLESAVPFGFAIFTYLLLVLFSVWDGRREGEYQMRVRTRVYMFVVFGILTVFTLLSMVNHTIMIMFFGSESADATYNVREAIYQIPYIGGLQGRYFLPFLALPFLALPGRGKHREGKIWIVAGYIVLAMIVTFFVLYQRYWTAL